MTEKSGIQLRGNTADAGQPPHSGIRATRRAVLGTLIAGAFGVSNSYAQEFPGRSVRLVAPFTPGTITDLVARTVAQGLQDKWKQPVVVDNRSGAGGLIGASAVATAPPDGYTLLMGSNGTHAINPTLYPKLPYDAVKSFAPISMVASGYSLLVVHPSVEAKSVTELIALAKAKSGQLMYGSGGIGTTPHLAGELFRMMAGIQINHVPYKGSTHSTLDLIEGRIHMIFANVPSVLQYIKAGKLRVLAVTSPQRVKEFPDVPTVSESGLPGFSADFWMGLFAPAGTPGQVVERINQQVRSDLANEEIVRKYGAQGVVIKTSTPEAFATHLRDEIVKWRDVVVASGAKPE